MISWQQPGRPIILASQSPRRKQILTQMGLTFETIAPAPIDEAAFFGSGNLDQSLMTLAAAKAESVAANNPTALVLGADTIVVKGDRVLGKPSGREEALAMLRSLSNARHTVMTGIALLCKKSDFSVTAVAGTEVYFRDISMEEIEAYLEFDEYRDKAGAYAIQGKAMIFIEKIEGCFYNVVGLPVARTIDSLKRFISYTGAR